MVYRPGWVNHLIGWHVYPLGFVGAPTRLESQEVSHRLAHLEAWLDHAVALGCSGLALGPVFSSASHGYDTLDYFTIDPRLGDDDDFDHLLQAAHALVCQYCSTGCSTTSRVATASCRMRRVLGQIQTPAAWFAGVRGTSTFSRGIVTWSHLTTITPQCGNMSPAS